MEEPRNLLRYAIPGWLFLLHLMIFGLIHERVVNEVVWPRVPLDHLEISLVAVIVAGLGVPLGYLVSQVYFALYWRCPWGLGLRRVDHRPVARGARLLGLVPYNWPVRNRRDAWDIVIFLWYVAPNKSELEWAEKKGETLANIYHSLGATYFALWLACVTYVVANLALVRAGNFTLVPWSLLVAILVAVIALLSALCYAKAQREAAASLEAFTERVLLYFYR